MDYPRHSRIRGHRLQLDLLRRLIAAGRHGHAYLFEGPEGIGKLTVARAFVGRLACWGAAASDTDPCGHCRSCAALERDQHPDLTVLLRDGVSIKIDQVREALQRLRYEPVVGRIKAVIIDGADTLREEAANALLKTLEEPPPATVFVLVTSKPQVLLDTIRSRCQVLRFTDLPEADIAALLVAGGADEAMALTAAALAQGSLTQAQQLCDPGRLALADLVAEFALRLGADPPAAAAPFTDRLIAHIGAASGDEKVKRDLGRDDLVLALDALRAVLRDVLMVQCGQDLQRLPYARHALALRQMAARVDPSRLARGIELCQRLEGRLSLNPNTKLAWVALLVELGTLLRD